MSAFLYVYIRTTALTTHILHKNFPKTYFVKGYSSVLKYRFLNKLFINICSLRSAEMDLQKCWRKSAYFFKKQNRKKTDEKQIMFKSALSSQDLFIELNLRLSFDLISKNNMTKILKQPS